MTIRLIGVPFDGMGRKPGQAGAPAALRAAGLEASISSHDIVSRPDLMLPEARAERALKSGLLNETALVKMVAALYAEVSASLSAGHFPLVYGADCSVLLAAVPAMRDVLGEVGLLFVDGHEDATPIDRSPDGEAANMEIAILLGMTGERLMDPLRKAVNAIKPQTLAILGPRDQPGRRELGRRNYRQPCSAAELGRSSGRSIWCYALGNREYFLSRIKLVVTHRSGCSQRTRLLCARRSWRVSLSGALTWRQLTEVIQTGLSVGGCRGWSLAIYNPDLDPDDGNQTLTTSD